MTTAPVIEKQLVDIDLSGGMDESMTEESVDWTKRLISLKNIVFNGNGLQTRPGTRVVTPSTSGGLGLASLIRLGNADNGLLAVAADAGLYQLWESKAVPELTIKDYVPRLVVSGKTVSSAPGGTFASTVGCYGIVSMTRYQAILHPYTDVSFRLVIIDKLSGQAVRSLIFHDAANGLQCPAMVAVDDRYIHLYVSKTSTTAPRMTVIDTTALVDDASQLTYTAVTGASAGDRIAGVVAVTNASVVVMRGTTCRIEKFNNSKTSVSNNTVAGIRCTSLDIDGATFCLYGNDGTNYLYKEVSAAYSTTRTVTGPVIPAGGVGEIRGAAGTTLHDSRMVAYVEESDQNAGKFPCAAVYTLISGSTSFTSLGYLPHWNEASQPVFSPADAQFYIHMHNIMRGDTDDYIANADAVINISAASGALSGDFAPRYFRPEAVLDTYTAADGHPNNGTSYSTTGVTFYSSGVVATAYRPALTYNGGTPTEVCFVHWSRASALNDSALLYSLDQATVLTTPSEKLHLAPTFISSGLLASYDGYRVQEHGFVHAPNISVKSNATGSSAAGIYNYVAVFCYRDKRGNVYRSRSSRPRAITLLASKSVDVQVVLPTVTLRCGMTPAGYSNPETMYVEIYRTAAGGTQYYLAAIKKIATAASSATDPDAEVYVTVNDTVLDATLTANPLMYRQPGTAGTALDRYHALASTHAVNHKDRIFYANGTNVYYSSFAVEFEGPWFSPAFYFSVPGGSGDITGLASMDGLLVVFKRDAIFVVDGDGPPENGGNGTEFSPPRRIQTEFGCIDARTIVAVTDGLMYRSAQGIQALSRNLQVSFIGQLVERTVDANTVNYGATFDRLSGRVMFPMSGSGNLTVPTYDTIVGAWSVSVYVGNAGGDFCFGHSVSDLGNKGDYVYVIGDNRVLFEDWTSGLDKFTTTDVFVPWTIETGWVKAPSKQERVRVSDLLVIGTRQTNHNLKCEYAKNYVASYATIKTFTGSDTNVSPEQLEFQPAVESVQAMKFKLTTVTPTVSTALGVGTQLNLFGMSVRIGLKGGGAKVPAVQKG